MDKLLKITTSVFEKNDFYNFNDFISSWLADPSKREVWYKQVVRTYCVGERKALFFSQYDRDILLAHIVDFEVIVPKKLDYTPRFYLDKIKNYFSTFDTTPYKLGE